MNPSSFDRFNTKLEQNVYGSLKGTLRLQLILEDITEFCPSFNEKQLSILDLGGGNGYFSRICLKKGHRVLLVDSSKEMLDKAGKELALWKESNQLSLLQMDCVAPNFSINAEFNLVLMHGSAEWTTDPELAILRACDSLKSGGYLSLLLYNKDKYILKQGINGHLLDTLPWSKKKKLTPPGARTVSETKELLKKRNGELLLQSGIRIFYGFFRQIDRATLTPLEWLKQERLHYRAPPFSSLGEHTHYIWQSR